ncbi:MAG: hypothetical protein EU532_09695 [Promethearchaeota archaeon]|nr:MAG: hypothetical protein EU532_09695 [Candidatus Lokiarchaeota archaeon]
MLILRTSDQIRDGDICVIGQGIPMIAGAIAKRKHAPHAIILTEAGMLDINPFENLDDVADPGSSKGFSCAMGLYDVFGTIVNRNFADLAFLGALQVDKYGNINTTVIGNYFLKNRSDIRFAGSGGSNEFMGHCKQTVITIVGGKFVKKLDYITSPGWLSGGNSRQKAGLPGGPECLISKYGLFKFHDESKEMYLCELFPETELEDIQEEIPWKIKTAEDFGESIHKLDPPSKADLKFIREFDAIFGIGGHEGRRLESQALPVYYEGGRANK